MLSTVLYYELAMKVPIPVGITVYLLTWGLGHLRCLVMSESTLTLVQWYNRVTSNMSKVRCRPN